VTQGKTTVFAAVHGPKKQTNPSSFDKCCVQVSIKHFSSISALDFVIYSVYRCRVEARGVPCQACCGEHYCARVHSGDESESLDSDYGRRWERALCLSECNVFCFP
jgi:hypothetical protein